MKSQMKFNGIVLGAIVLIAVIATAVAQEGTIPRVHNPNLDMFIYEGNVCVEEIIDGVAHGTCADAYDVLEAMVKHGIEVAFRRPIPDDAI